MPITTSTRKIQDTFGDDQSAKRGKYTKKQKKTRQDETRLEERMDKRKESACMTRKGDTNATRRDEDEKRTRWNIEATVRQKQLDRKPEETHLPEKEERRVRSETNATTQDDEKEDDEEEVTRLE